MKLVKEGEQCGLTAVDQHQGSEISPLSNVDWTEVQNFMPFI